MFCPSCGFEYTQQTNYCKGCGKTLGVTSVTDSPPAPRPKIATMFWAIAAFCIASMLILFAAYDKLSWRGLRGEELLAPFMLGLVFTGAIAGLLIWQLARMITTHQQAGRNVIVEKHFIRENQPAQLGAPTDSMPQVVEPSSVIEHTTRQYPKVHRESNAPK